MITALLRFRPTLLLLLTLLAAGAAALGPAAWVPAAFAADDALRPGEFQWTPQLAPSGPLAVIVSLPAQRAYVYRNGVRIGVSTVSTGKPGYDTPSGIYTVLQKHREHHSNLYDDAPMPFMQRLTWDGVALHAGGLPGYPASHGCIRLPEKFAELLFSATTPGTIVVVAAADTFPSSVVSPGLFSPVEAQTGSPVEEAPLAPASSEWHPEHAVSGPITVLLSTYDKRLVVLRNAIEIGRADVMVNGEPVEGTEAYLLLSGRLPQPSVVVPDRPALRWSALRLPNQAAPSSDMRRAFAEGQVAIPPEFARRIYDLLEPGTTVIVTDQPLQPRTSDVTVLSSGGGPHD